MSKRANGEGTAYRYRGGWAAQVTVKDELGRPKRKTVYGKTQAEVLSKKTTLTRAAAAGVTTAGQKVKLSLLLESWLTQTLPARVQLGQLSSTTFDSYRDLVRRHIIPSLGHLPANQLTAPQIRSWLTEKSKETSARGRPLSARTVQYLHAVLRKALADAVRDGLLERNVALLVEPPRGRAPRVQPLSLEEAQKLLKAAVDDPHRLLWLTLLSLGLRRGEALALRWDDIDLEDQLLLVRRSLQRVRGDKDATTGKRRGELIEKAPKTAASIRRLALPQFLADEFRQHRGGQLQQRMAALAWVDPGLVFTTGVGTALEPRNVNRAWQALGEKAELDRHIRVHDLRHAAASFLLLQGADMRVVMDQLGHSRMATTSDLYTHVLDEVRREAAARMDGLLSGLGKGRSAGS